MTKSMFNPTKNVILNYFIAIHFLHNNPILFLSEMGSKDISIEKKIPTILVLQTIYIICVTP